MFSEPLLAHPAEIGGVHASWHPHTGDHDDRDQHHDDADDEQHVVFAAVRFPRSINDPDTRPGDCLCTCAQGAGHVNCELRSRRGSDAGVAKGELGFHKADTWEAALDAVGLAAADVQQTSQTWAETLVRFLTNPILAAVLMTVGLGSSRRSERRDLVSRT